MELKKLQGENEEQYLWRIGQLIDSGKIESWQSINHILNSELGIDEDQWRAESTFRKKYQAAKKFYDNVFSIQNCESDDYIKELDVKRREIEKERQKLYATKTEYTRAIRQQSRFELFYENIKDAIQTMEPPDFQPIECSEDNETCHVLTLADIHAGACFSTQHGCYSLSECQRRFAYLASRMREYIKQNHVDHLKVVCLGDCIQGILRLSDLTLNESTVVYATVFVAREIANLLNYLSQYCYIGYYHVPTSNHSQNRHLSSKASELAGEDVEFIIGNYIQDVLCTNERVSVNLNFGEEYIVIPILNKMAIAMHGHQFSSPKNALKDICFSRQIFYDYLFLAHFHAGAESTDGACENDLETFVCPSFVGQDPYAERKMKGAKAACKVFKFDSRYGHTDTHKIILN